MNTTMVREGGITPISTVEQGGEAILHLAAGDDVAGKSGLFFNGMRQARANPQAYDDAARKRLRALSLELTGLAGRLTGPAAPSRRCVMVSKALRSAGGADLIRACAALIASGCEWIGRSATVRAQAV